MDHPSPPSADPEAAARRAQAQAIRRRLMERVADDDGSHLTVQHDEGEWQPFMDGVTIKVLREQDGVLTYLLRLAPGAVLPPHRHPVDEECIVLDGQLRIGSKLDIGPGGYHLAHAGALHASIGSSSGATVFLRGAVPDIAQLLG